MQIIWHITTEAAWAAAQVAGVYQADSLASEGFIHCSTTDQILIPANSFYRGQRGLVLLALDADELEPEVVFEDCYESGTAFPHVYGAIRAAAVKTAVPFPPNADGTFELPPEVVAFEQSAK